MKELLGGCVFTVGLLIAGATGLCTLMFIKIDSWANLGRALNAAGSPFLFGVCLMVVGVVIIFSGRKRRY
jgi:hypothetical protein